MKYTKTVYPNATSYNVSGLDLAMLFDKLAFIAGVLANIKHEGTIGIFEYCYVDKASEPAYLQYMEDHFV